MLKFGFLVVIFAILFGIGVQSSVDSEDSDDELDQRRNKIIIGRNQP
jgi:hypothetical protein